MPSDAHERLVQLMVENPTPADATVEARRAGYDAFLGMTPVPDDARIEETDAEGVSLTWVAVPESREDRVILHVHGGGGVMGSARTYRELAARLARSAGARVAVPDYRLAPEAPFPAGIDDIVRGYGALLRQGVPSERIVISGDSAGAGFALVAITRARDEGLALPAGVVGFTPWIDLAVGETIAEAADVDDPVSTRDGMRWFSRQYLQDASPTSPLANVLHASLHGLPPLLLLAGTRDIVHGDALRMGRLARAAGVRATVRSFHGLIHNWQMAAHLPEAAEALALAGAFVTEVVGEEVALTQERVK